MFRTAFLLTFIPSGYCIDFIFGLDSQSPQLTLS